MRKFNEYMAIDAVNSSQLKAILKSPQAYLEAKKRDKDWKAHFTIGSLVDMKLTEPEEVSKTFKISEKLPGEKPLAVINMLQKDPEMLVTEALTEVEYRMNMSSNPEKWIAKFEEESGEFLDIIKEGFIPVTFEDFTKAEQMVQQVMESSYGYLFEKDTPCEFQYSIEGTLRARKVKCLLDVVEHTNEKVIQPWDIKTSSDPMYLFPMSVRKYRYDIQMALYFDILKQKFPEHTVLPPKLLVIDKNGIYPPTAWQMNVNDLQFGRFGGIYNGFKYDGYNQALDKIAQHEVDNQWEYPLEFNQVNKTIELDAFRKETI